jgi:hypothetical protein
MASSPIRFTTDFGRNRPIVVPQLEDSIDWEDREITNHRVQKVGLPWTTAQAWQFGKAQLSDCY